MQFKRHIRIVGLLVAVAIGAAACSSGSSPSSGYKPKPGKNGIVIFSWKTSYGTAVGSIDGIVAYADKNESGSKSECTGSCTDTWHPWVTDGAAVHPAANSGVQASLIGTVKRSDGSTQITYGGHPLYLYAHTKNALVANAQGAGGVWYIVGLDGNLITS